MPAVSKKQQKFFGIVRSIQKGDAPASKFSKSAQKAAKTMKKIDVKDFADTDGEDLPTKVKKEERDYKAEYKKFQSSPKMKKYRAELNQYNRKRGTYGNGDGKDASHKGGKIAGFEKESTNRGRAEKSRLKKEGKEFTDRQLASRIAYHANLHKGTGVGYANAFAQIGMFLRDIGYKKSFIEAVKVMKVLAKKKKVESVNEAKPKLQSFKFKFKCMECGKSFIKSLRRSLEVKCPKCKSVDIELENVNVSGEIIKEALHPYKDFNQQDQEKQYDLNLGAFIDKYQQMMKFMKKYKEVPDKNKRTWAALIRKKVGQGRFNGLIGDWAQVTQYLKSFDKFRNKKDDYAWDIKGESTKRDYKAEYKKYGSSIQAKKYRAELNKYNRKKGTYGNGDGKDASHKGGKIVGFEKESTNRGRREKSRLKKENIRKSINEAVEPQGNMAKIAKIVKRKQASKLGGVMIDMQSASLLMKLWDAVSDKDKEKMNTLNPKVLTTVIKKLWSRVNLKLPM